MSPIELGKLASRLAKSKSPAMARKHAMEITRSFYADIEAKTLKLIEVEETSEMLVALDAARRSLREGKGHTVDQARDLIAQWTIKSS